MTQLLTMGHSMSLEYLACCSGEAMSPINPVAHLLAPRRYLPCPGVSQMALDAYA